MAKTAGQSTKRSNQSKRKELKPMTDKKEAKKSEQAVEAKKARKKKVKNKYADSPPLKHGMVYGTSDRTWKDNVFHLENSGLTTIQAAEEADAIREAS